jgi:hypothetical protein
MWSQRYERTRKGDRAEYLAQYILSGFSLCVPVPRQEDGGIDFHCSLLRREGEFLRPSLAYNVQVKNTAKPIVIGGVTDGGAWRQHEIERFCKQEVPPLIGIVDDKEQRLDLFSTAVRFFVGRWKDKIIPRELWLMPYKPGADEQLTDGELEELDDIPNMPRHRWKLGLGQPIVTIPVADSDDPARREIIKGLLEPYLRQDARNIVIAEIGLGYFEWPWFLKPNEGLNVVGMGMTSGFPVSEQQLDTTIRVIASLLGDYRTGKQRERIMAWLPVLGQFDLSKAHPFIRESIEKAVAYAKGEIES